MSVRSNRRKCPRYSITGEAFWSAGRLEDRCRLRNLSAGGVELAEPTPPLEVGTHLRVSLLIHDALFESVPVEVVRNSEDSLGLRFLKPDDDLLGRIEALTEDLTPIY